MDLDKLINEMGLEATPAPTKPLSRVAGRDFVYKNPGMVKVTRQDRQDLLKTTDPAQVKAAVESAFEQIIAAVTGTSAQNTAIAKINQLRKQIFADLDRSQPK